MVVLSKTRRCLIAGVGAVTGLGLMAACSSGGGDGESVTIRAGWVPTVHSTHWATTSQFIEDENVTLELSPFKTNNEMFVAMESGSLDMMTMGYNNTATALARDGADYQYVAGVSEGGTRILVREDLDIESWEDIAGLSVGTAQGSTQYQQLVLAMRANGLDIDTDVDYTNIGGAPDMSLALSRGDVDLVSTWEPSASEAIEQGMGKEVPAISESIYEDSFRLNSGLAVRTGFSEEHPEAVQAVVDAYVEAYEKVSSDEDWWREQFSELASGTPEGFDLALENLTPTVNLEQEQVEQLAAQLFEAGLIDQDVTEQMAELLDYSYLEKSTGKSTAELGAEG